MGSATELGGSKALVGAEEYFCRGGGTRKVGLLNKTQVIDFVILQFREYMFEMLFV